MGYLFRYRPTDMKIKDYVCMSLLWNNKMNFSSLFYYSIVIFIIVLFLFFNTSLFIINSLL